MLTHGDALDQYGNYAQLVQTIYSGSWQYITLPGFPRTGTACLACDSFSGIINLPVPAFEGVFGHAFRTSSFGGDQRLTFKRGGGDIFTWRVNAAGAVEVRQGDQSGPLLGTSNAGDIQLNSWCMLEIGWGMGVAGYVEFRKNGTPILVISGINFGGSIAPIDQYVWSTTVAMYMDDIYMTDTDGPAPNNGFLGDIRCRGRWSNGVGADQDWALVGGATAADCINNSPIDPAKYIAASAAGDISSFPMTPIPTNTSQIFGQVIYANLSKSDAGGCAVDLGIDSNGAVVNLPSITPGTGINIYHGVIENDPDTGIPWTLAKAQLLLARLERTL